MTLGQKIRNLRKAKNLSQQELAEKIGITKTQISRWEKGHVQPRQSNLRDLAELFGVSDEDFQDLTPPGALELMQDDPELLEMLSQVSSLKKEHRKALKHVLQSMITCQRLQDLAAVS